MSALGRVVVYPVVHVVADADDVVCIGGDVVGVGGRGLGHGAG